MPLPNPRRCAAPLFALLAACTAPAPAAGGASAPAPAVEAACRALLAAEPGAWPERIDDVLAFGDDAATVLARLVRESPAAPSAGAAIAVLGRLCGSAAVELCRELVAERSPLATEAALALGECGAAAARDTLLHCAADRTADATLRTAAACSLLRLGERSTVAPVLVAVVRAGTPAAAADDVGLPHKTRWALERYLVQRALQQIGEPALAQELDTDAPWPELAAFAGRLAAWLRG